VKKFNKMGLLKKFCKNNEQPLGELNEILEIEIFKLLGQAELLLKSNPNLGIKLFRRADSLYLLKGYDIKIECQINNVYLSYIKNS